MPLLSLILALVIVGFILYVVNVYVPMQPTIKKILNVVVIIIVVLFLLQSFGLLPALNDIRLR